MVPLASAGVHVIAPDQRGYGRTTGWDPDYDGDLASFRFLYLVKDVLGLVFALGYRSVHAVVGHDFGSPVAAYCALAWIRATLCYRKARRRFRVLKLWPYQRDIADSIADPSGADDPG